MANYKLLTLLMGVLMIVVACEPDEPPLTPRLSGSTSELVGTWRYDSVVIKGQGFVFATFDMIPGLNQSKMGGLRAELKRRLINYMPDGTYQLVWDDRGDYQLGVDTMSSWQPNYGYWQMDESSMVLIHNNDQYYQTDYTITAIDDRRMVRSYYRRMAENSILYGPGNPSLWTKNQLVEYSEYFSREEQSRF